MCFPKRDHRDSALTRRPGDDVELFFLDRPRQQRADRLVHAHLLCQHGGDGGRDRHLDIFGARHIQQHRRGEGAFRQLAVRIGVRAIALAERDPEREIARLRGRAGVVTFLLKTLGTMYSSLSSSGAMQPAIAFAAASFIGSLMSRARASSAPRKMPGNANTLLIWLG